MSREVRIATFNLQNLLHVPADPALARGGAETIAELETQLAKLALAIQASLALPDIIAVQEVESEQLLQRLADRVNAASASRYRAVSPPTSDLRGIRVGFLFDENRVGLTRSWQMEGPGVEAAFGAASNSPGREPLVGVFQVDGRDLTLIANHFKSNYVGDVETPLREQMLRANERQRMAQAGIVRSFVNRLLTADGKAWVIVAGDLNDCPRRALREDRISPVSILEGTGADIMLTNLLLSLGGPHAYTFLGSNGPEILDHILVSPGAAERVTAVSVHHINTPFPQEFAADPATPFRSSDHDPLLAEFQL